MSEYYEPSDDEHWLREYEAAHLQDPPPMSAEQLKIDEEVAEYSDHLWELHWRDAYDDAHVQDPPPMSSEAIADAAWAAEADTAHYSLCEEYRYINDPDRIDENDWGQDTFRAEDDDAAEWELFVATHGEIKDTRRLSWDDIADGCLALYDEAMVQDDPRLQELEEKFVNTPCTRSPRQLAHDEQEQERLLKQDWENIAKSKGLPASQGFVLRAQYHKELREMIENAEKRLSQGEPINFSFSYSPGVGPKVPCPTIAFPGWPDEDEA